MESSSNSGSFRQANKVSSKVARCLVDGCIADMSLCRDYHRRHKVCEVHSKTPKVNIRGLEQRFCQQCSRFHSLVEFDQGKRSCRKRLDCHNRRRRKPQHESMLQNSSFFIANQSSSSGTTFISFGSTFPDRIKGENMSLYNNQHQQVTLNESYSSNAEMKFFSEGMNHQVIVPDGAPSLLSSARQFTKTFSLNNSNGIEALPCTQPPSLHDLNYNGFDPFRRDTESIVSSARYNETSVLNPHFAGMLQHDEGSSSGGSRQTLSFFWE